MSSPYVVGIDLGTTNSAVAFSDGEDGVQLFAVPQVVQPGTVEPRPMLPSFLYLAAEGELPAAGLDLPWDTAHRDFAVGELAYRRGIEVPGRLVSSAKSWLSHAGADRTADILPWGAGDEVEKLSPLEASARYLAHLRDAWNYTLAKGHPELRFEAQEIYLTVPASFDPVARELTARAAQQVGLEKVILLEEPQAAVYAWIAASGDGWRHQVDVGDVILVCDVGGGTTDFSLIAVGQEGGELTLERVAVGDHILLGGDNMDLALAYALRARLEASGTKLDAWQFRSLALSCRQAKERMLSGETEAKLPVSILGRGRKVVGGTLRVDVERSDVEASLLEGFFPACDLADGPQITRRVGLQELGLPYAADAAVTRHLAAFLSKHGGPVRVLPAGEPELAVARGAAYYGLARRGRGVRIRGGTARSFYLGVETAMPAVPGMRPPLKAVCVLAQGVEEGGDAVDLPSQELGLVVGEPAEFRFLASTSRQGDTVGDVLESWDGDLEELPALETALAWEGHEGTTLPVRLQARVNEVGVLELWFVARDGEQRWKLEFSTRGAST